MKKSKKAVSAVPAETIVAGLLSGVIIFFYILSLILISTVPFIGKNAFLLPSLSGLAAAGVSFAVFLTGFCIHSSLRLHHGHLTRSAGSLPMFILFSIIILITSVALQFLLIRLNAPFIIMTTIVMTAASLCLFPVIGMTDFVLRLIVVNFFPSVTGTAAGPGFSTLLEKNEFIRECLNTASRSDRYKLATGFLGFRILNTGELEQDLGPEGMTFLSRQIVFLITQNSRTYEPWMRTQEKDIYINVMQFRSAQELAFAEERFKKLMLEHDFTVLDRSIRPAISIRSTLLDPLQSGGPEELPPEERVTTSLERLIQALKKG
jgi:hypothetical protein